MKKILLSTLVASFLTTTSGIAADDFAPFWVKFKAAVAKNDVQAIANMTKFPYAGDENPLNRAQFIKQCPKIFDAKSRKILLKEKPVKDKDYYEVFVGESIFIFTKVNGKYMFTEVGVND